MSPHKGVRFSNDAPNLVESNWAVPDFCPGPEFSPTQVPRQERVLHSIFSPSYHLDKVQPSTSTSRPIPQTAQPLQTVDPTTPLRKQNNPGERDIFFSPQQPSNISPISGISAFTESRASPPKRQNDNETNPTSTSFDTLYTIDMLNFKFIEGCTSVSDLQRVVKSLAEQPSHSPHLLQAANDRIVQLQGRLHPSRTKQNVPSSVKSESEDSSGDFFFTNDATLNISRITTANVTMDSMDPSKSSLNFSLSPQSDLRGTNLVETPHGGTANGLAFFPAASNTRLKPIKEVTDQSPVVNDRHELLSEEVKELSKQAMDLENSRASEQESFVRQLEELGKVDKSAQQLMKDLNTKEKQRSSQPPPPPLVETLRKLQKEREESRKALEKERAAFKLKNEKAKSLEKRLMQKVSDISKELQTSKEHARLAVGAERSLRLKQEQELALQTQRAENMNRTLQETKNNLELLRRKHSQFRLELLRSIGASFSEVKELSQQNFIDVFAKKVKTMKEENETMSRALKEADQSKLAAENGRLNRHLQTVLTSKKKLEEQNRQLSSQIKELLEEVASSRAYIDKLLKTSHETQLSDWEKREAQYKTVIQNLRLQVRKQNPTVSIELYKAAVDGNKATEAELKRATTKISTLELQVNQLEKEKLEARLLSNVAKTPSQKSSFDKSGFASPTDYLERGLLGKQTSPAHNDTSNFMHAGSQRLAVSYSFLSPRKTDEETKHEEEKRAKTNFEAKPSGHLSPAKNAPTHLTRIESLLPVYSNTFLSPKKTATREATNAAEKRSQKPAEVKNRISTRNSDMENIIGYGDRRAGLPLAGIKAAASFDVLAQDKASRIANDQHIADDGNLAKDRPKQCLMGMTISFPKEPSVALVASPLSEPDYSRVETRREEDVSKWLDNYTSNQEKEKNREKADGQRNKEKNKLAITTKHANAKSGRRKAKKDGSRERNRIEVYIEPGLLDTKHKSNGETSRRAPGGPESGVGKKSSSGNVVSSADPKPKPLKENRKPTSAKSKSKISARIVKVREMGGRKGLQERLKKMRSPPGKARSLRPIAVN